MLGNSRAIYDLPGPDPGVIPNSRHARAVDTKYWRRKRNFLCSGKVVVCRHDFVYRRQRDREKFRISKISSSESFFSADILRLCLSAGDGSSSISVFPTSSTRSLIIDRVETSNVAASLIRGVDRSMGLSGDTRSLSFRAYK